LFIKENEPVIHNNEIAMAEDDYVITSDNQLNVSINSINSALTAGIVWDIARDGSTLLVSSAIDEMMLKTNESVKDPVLNMSLYNFETNQKNPLGLSNKNQSYGFIDYKNKGYVYLENTEPDPTQLAKFRLLWSDLEGSTTKSISAADEHVSRGYTMVNDDLLIYGNQRGEIHLVNRSSTLTNPNGSSRTYQTNDRLMIVRIDLWEEENMAVFGAFDSDTNAYNLYLASLTKQNPEPVLIQENIFFFELSRDEDKILYSTASERETQRLVLYDLKNASHKVIKNGYLGLFAFSKLGDKIVYSERTDSTTSSQNLWIMDTQSGKTTQMASNLNIFGNRMVFHPYQTTIYFTVFEIRNEKEANQRIHYNVYSIDYSVY
jgi:hypothetical protein